MKWLRTNSGFAVASLLIAVSLTVPAHSQEAQGGGAEVESGASGSSPGSAGMDDNDKTFTDAVRKAAIKGRRSPYYVGSLVELGMHYNRKDRFVDAAKALTDALSIIDSGAIKPTPANRPPDSVKYEQSGNIASMRIDRTPTPYEDVMADLLPALVEAENGCGQLKQAEVHVKRLMALPAADQLRGKLNLMSAYHQYSEILRKQHRTAQADAYQKKADDINHSFKPL